MSKEMVSIKEQINKQLAQQNKTFESPSAAKISTAGKKFTLPNGQTSHGPMRVIVLDHRNVHTYYTGVYNPNSPEKPKCFSIGQVIADLAPAEAATDPQCETCAECEKNAWGSDPQGGKGKACKNGIRLAVVPADMPQGTEPLALDVSPTSIRSWNALVQKLDANGVLPVQTIVDVSFNPDQTFPQLVFELIGENEDLERAWQLREDAQIMLSKHPSDR